jgi:hypothetical protein
MSAPTIDPCPPTAVLTAPSATAPTSVAELAERFAAAGATVVDVDELVAAIEATGVSDRQAQLRYGLPSVFALGEAVLAHLWATRGRPAPRPRLDAEPFLRASLSRAALFLTPAVAAAAVQGPLARVAWSLLAATLVVGWAGAQALAYVAYAKASRGTPSGALRFLGTGFLALAALWCAAVALLPPDLVGHRSTAYLVCLGELAMFAGTAAALVGGTAPAVLHWSAPVWLVGFASVLSGVDLGGLLLAAVALAVGRAYAPAFRRDPLGPRYAGPVPVLPALGHLLVGAGQAASFLLVWRIAPADGPGLPPAAVPLLMAVPLIEVFIAWHASRAAAGLATYDDVRAYHRHLRILGTVTVTLLVPPLVMGAGLAAAAFRLPYGLSAHPGARAIVLALAAGVLLGGVYALALLLATRRRLATAALVAAAPVLFAAVIGAGSLVAVPPTPTGSLMQVMLPGTVAGLAATYLLGLVTAAHAVFHPGSYR